MSNSRSNCRSCGSEGLQPFLDLGMMPLSDGLRTPAQLTDPERRYPLEVAFCSSCALVQILEEVDPEELFCKDYPYYSSFTDSLLEHSRNNVRQLIASQDLDEDSFVVEVASNDGYLLQYFVESGIPVQGIDPAQGPASTAIEKGIPTINAFFTEDLAKQMLAQGHRADVIIGNNVLAHVPDLNGFVAGIATLLSDTGTTSIEAPYIRNLIDECQFDTIYHEHLCYYSVTAVQALFHRHGLHLNKVEHLPIHGGSIRYYASPTPRPDGSVERFLAEESDLGLNTLAYYQNFGKRVQQLRSDLLGIIHSILEKGQTIAAYGAAAKGAIMLNYVGLDENSVRFCADRNIHKQGKFMPGVAIEIVDPKIILESMPDYLLVLPWNFQDEIISQQAEYRARGGQFLVPVPTPHIVPNDGT
jgi:hypothetical protein